MDTRPKRGYGAGFFALTLDPAGGSASSSADRPAFLRSVDGGFYEGSIVSEALGANLHQSKHLGIVEPKPIKFECGLATSSAVLKWIYESWEKKQTFRNGRIDHGSPVGGAIHGHLAQTFEEALITSVTFPAMSSKSKGESVYLNVEVQPRTVALINGDDQPLSYNSKGEQVRVAKAQFVLEIQNEVIYANKIDAITVTQHMKKLYYGRKRHAELVPAALEVSPFAIYTNVAQSDYLLGWYNDRLEKDVTGNKEKANNRTATITYRSLDNEDLFSLELEGVGIYALNVEKSVAGSSDLKQVKTSLYAESIKLDPSGPLFD